MKAKKFGKTKFAPAKEKTTENNPTITPKYITFARVKAEYGITKGRMYPLLKDNRVASITLVEDGKSRGTRLIVAASLERYLKSLETE